MSVEQETEAAEGTADDESAESGASDEAAPGGGGGDDGAGGTRTFGLERYVMFAVIGGAMVILWLLDKIVTMVWDQFAEAPGTIITAGSAAVAVAALFFAYEHPTVNKLASERAQELSKGTGPARGQTYAATIVVIVTPVTAAILIGLFDTAWSGLTDLVYKF